MKYRVLGNLKHNGTNYVENVEIELSEETAKQLIKDGTIEPIEEEKVEVKKEFVKEEEEKEEVKPVKKRKKIKVDK
jgi:hypothetical protein